MKKRKSKKTQRKSRRSTKASKPQHPTFKLDILNNFRRFDPKIRISKKGIEVLELMFITRLKETIKLAEETRMSLDKRVYLSPEDLEAALKLQCRGKLTAHMIEEGKSLVSEQKKQMSRPKADSD
jgi:hypothetical protein